MGSVLIVENNGPLREVLAELLTDLGWSVVEARNGREAVSHLWRSEPPTAILLDLDLPNREGWQLRRMLLADPRRSAVPVILLSGQSAREARLNELEASAWLRKPFEVPHLLNRLQAACSRGC